MQEASKIRIGAGARLQLAIAGLLLAVASLCCASPLQHFALPVGGVFSATTPQGEFSGAGQMTGHYNAALKQLTLHFSGSGDLGRKKWTCNFVFNGFSGECEVNHSIPFHDVYAATSGGFVATIHDVKADALHGMHAGDVSLQAHIKIIKLSRNAKYEFLYTLKENGKQTYYFYFGPLG